MVIRGVGVEGGTGAGEVAVIGDSRGGVGVAVLLMVVVRWLRERRVGV